METNPSPVADVRPPAESSAPRPSSPRKGTGLRALALAGVAALIVGAIAAPRWSSNQANEAADSPEGQPVQRDASAETVTTPQPVEPPAATPMTPAPVQKPVAPVARELSKKTPARNAEKNRLAAAPTKSSLMIVVPAADKARAEESVTTSAGEVSTKAPVVGSIAAEKPVENVVARPPVTITGCLEMSVDENEFQLADTEGVNVPKSRSWRTGFLKKRSASVALVDASDPQFLRKQIGKRVAATGQLTNRDLKLSTLRVVAPSCN